MWFVLKKAWNGNAVGSKIEIDDKDAQPLVDAGFVEKAEDPATDIADSVADRIAKSLTEKVAKSVSDRLDNRLPRIEAVASAEDKTKSCGDFLICVAKALRSPAHAERLDRVYKASMSSQTGGTGGYLVPTEFHNQIKMLEAENSTFEPAATVYEIASGSIEIPVLNQTKIQSAGVSPMFGGLVATWSNENLSKDQSDPDYKQIKMSTNELSGYCPVSNTLLESTQNVFSLDKMLVETFAKTIAWYKEYAFLVGDGVGKPLGVKNAPATISVTRNTNTDFKYVDAVTMLSKLIPSSVSRARWYMSQSVLPKLLQMKDENNSLIFLPKNYSNPAAGGDASQAMVPTLLGIPIIFTEKVPALGTSGDVMLVDPSAYIVVNSGSIEVAVSTDYLFRTNQTAWRFISRTDGRPWLDSYVTLQDGNTTVSPFVKLT